MKSNRLFKELYFIIPIFTRQGSNGGIEINQNFLLKSAILKNSEKEKLLLALKV